MLRLPSRVVPHVSAPFTHVVSTRFCLGQGNVEPLVQARLMLFATICLPGMAAQSDKRFIWIIYADDTLPPSVQQQLRAMLSAHPTFHLVVLDSEVEVPRKDTATISYAMCQMPARQQLSRAGLQHQQLAQGSYILSTRIDADDSLSVDWASELHKSAEAAMSVRCVANSSAPAPQYAACFAKAMHWNPKSSIAFGSFGEHGAGALAARACVRNSSRTCAVTSARACANKRLLRECGTCLSHALDPSLSRGNVHLSGPHRRHVLYAGADGRLQRLLC